MNKRFYGGIHPVDRKSLSSGVMPIPAPMPKLVIIPMMQHIGAACTPLVQPGDKVKMGQMIGDGQGLCAPVHSSVSGTVLAVEPRRHTGGREILSAVIENDFRDTPDSALIPHAHPETLSADEVLDIIRRAGIVGMGGATFPSDVKALSSMGKIDTMLANACECEPYITADDMLLRTHADQVIAGMRILRRVLQAKRAVLAVEDNKQEAIGILREKLAQKPELELQVLPTRYPQGAEKQLIQAVTGREVPPGKLPAAVGCAVFNVATYASVYRAVCLGQALIERIVTVTGEGVRAPKNFITRIGTPFASLVEAAGGLRENAVKVLSGGPMMGFAQADLTAPVLKGTNAIVCLGADTKRELVGDTCIRCGKCLDACPMRLQPLYLFRYEKKKDLAALERYHAMDCIECGCCAYVCPGHLPLVERIRSAKGMLREASKK